jgi:hypothetical protein
MPTHLSTTITNAISTQQLKLLLHLEPPLLLPSLQDKLC